MQRDWILEQLARPIAAIVQYFFQVKPSQDMLQEIANPNDVLNGYKAAEDYELLGTDQEIEDIPLRDYGARL